MSWHAGPINSPRRLHAVGALSPRRPDQLKDAFLQSFQYSAGSGFDAHDFWDSFVASQNSKQVEQLTYFRSRPPSSASSRLSPRSTRTTPRTKPGKKLWESFGLPPPPQPQPRPPVFPKAPRETLGRPNILANRARLAAAAKKAGMSQFQMENLVTRTEDEMHSRYKDLHAAFKAVDVDDSGNVSKDELMRAMQRWNMGNANGSNIPLLQEAAAMLDALDQNGDGQISVSCRGRRPCHGASSPPLLLSPPTLANAMFVNAVIDVARTTCVPSRAV
jgi:Ca2+-binding EF-hand superfamily protein